tara:strand:- start:74 stop:523 length:450 start_codon:yes stop_codon:yes gene_type:complete
MKFYKIKENENGELLINKKANYSFNKIPDTNDLKLIDTSAIYVQIPQGRFYNEDEKKYFNVLKFHSDGFYKKEFLDITTKTRTKESILYGGKWRIENNLLELQSFYPSSGGKTNYYHRLVSKAIIKNGKLYFSIGPLDHSVYEKRIDKK